MKDLPNSPNYPDSQNLPDGFIARAATMEDADAVAEIVLSSEWRVAFEPESAGQDIREDWRNLDLPNDSWLVFAPDGRLAAAADVLSHGYVRLDAFVVVHPDFQHLGLGTYLLDATDIRTGELGDIAPPDSVVKVYRPTMAGNDAAERILVAHGYSEVRRFYTMQTLKGGLEEIQPPNTPEGITLRTFVAGQDERVFYEAQVESFEDHWGDEEDPFEEWMKQHLERSDFDPTLWWVASDDSSGEIAGVLISRARSGENGWVDILGVRRRWRGRGLGEALLRTAFREYARRGMSSVSLGVDTESPTGATRLYERAGMEVREESLLFAKEIRAAKK